jgi:hypothetical protein
VAKQLLYETYAFVPKPEAITRLHEDRSAGKSVFPLTIPGRLSICDLVNGNNRIYPKAVWEKNLAEGSQLQKSIAARSAFGLLEHPKDGKVDLNSPISHVLTKVWMEGNEVNGEITLVNTAEGHKLSALIEVGYNPLVSSRGYGTVVANDRGVDVVQEDYVCETWDCVFTPSFTEAELHPNREPPKAAAAEGPVKESAPAAKAQPLSEAAPPAPAADAKPSQPAGDAGKSPTKTTPMPDIKSINESVSRLRSVDPTKLDPQRFAESLTQAQQLHREVAALVAEDPKLSYDGRRIDDELNAIEKSFSEAATAPGREAATLKEQQTKTLKVLKGVAETALSYKGKMAETLKRIAALRDSLQAKARKCALLERKVDITCAALDEMTRRYNEDTTSLGRRLIILEFNPTDEAIKKRLNEATKPAHLLPIKEELKKAKKDGEKGGSKDAAGKVPSDIKDEKAGLGKVVAPQPAMESKDAPKDAPKDTPKDAPKDAPKAPEYPVDRPFTVAESTELTARLSKAVLNG